MSDEQSLDTRFLELKITRSLLDELIHLSSQMFYRPTAGPNVEWELTGFGMAVCELISREEPDPDSATAERITRVRDAYREYAAAQPPSLTTQAGETIQVVP